MTKRRLALFVILFLGLAAAVTAAWLQAPSSPAASRTEPLVPAVNPGVVSGEPLPTTVQAGAESADAGPAVTLQVLSSVDRRPLEGARVAVWKAQRFIMHHGPGPAGVGLTDASGTVRFTGLPEDELRVAVRLPYFEVLEAAFVPNGTVLLEPLAPVRGVVLNTNRTPAAGARVTTVEAPFVEATSGADGRFTLPWAASGVVVAEKDGLVGEGLYVAPHDAASELEIVLITAPSHAKVVNREGSPLEGVEVELRIGPLVLHFLTGADGTWACPTLPQVNSTVRFQKEGYVPVEDPRYLGRAGQDTVLSRGARLEGRLVHPDGSPVPGATIDIAGMAPSKRPPPATTDAQGRFTFGGLGYASVVVWATLGEKDINVEVALADGQTTAVTLVFEPEVIPVELAVVNENGTAVELWNAAATPIPDPGWSIHGAHMGTLELPRGPYRVVVTALDGRSAEVTLDAKPDQPPVQVVLAGTGEPEDTRPLQTLNVRVRTPAGDPVEGAAVRCVDGSATTGADGTAACKVHVVEESWPVPIIAWLGSAKGMTRATGKEPVVEVVVRSIRTLRGRVLGQLPASGTRVVYRSATQEEEVELKGNSFAIEGVDPVRTFVCVVQSEAEHDVVLGCAMADNTDDVVITVGAPGTLELAVLDENGEPLNKPIFYVDRLQKKGVPVEGGLLHLELPPGGHVLIINVEGRRARSETLFTIRPGEVTKLGTIRLQ
jgi:hypothetical protein